MTSLRRSFLVFLLLAAIRQANADELSGRVVGVADGDTITLLDGSNRQHKIRLSGIDAPENSQPFGRASKRALSDCAFGKYATVLTEKTDRYGRQIGLVQVDGVDCNLRQLDLGLAWHYKRYAHERPLTETRVYCDAELLARKARVGLWADGKATAPWEWRKRHG